MYRQNGVIVEQAWTEAEYIRIFFFLVREGVGEMIGRLMQCYLDSGTSVIYGHILECWIVFYKN